MDERDLREKIVGVMANNDWFVVVMADGAVWASTHPNGKWLEATPVPNTPRGREAEESVL